MKEKFLQFFTGQMGKSIYISVAAAVVCGAVVITSVVVVHNNNQKIDAVLESLSASESMTESVTETAAESVSDLGNEEPQPQVQAANNEPAGDKALQYLAEYNALTEEYEAKRAELVGQIQPTKVITPKGTPIEINKDFYVYVGERDSTPEEIASGQAELDAQYERDVSNRNKILEQNSRILASENAVNDSIVAKNDNLQKQIDALDARYEKDVAALKARYGIA